MRNLLSYIVPSKILEKYLLSEFLNILILSVLASTGLFLVFDTFERMKVFLSHDTPLLTALSYLGLKIPLIIQLMLPISTLISTLVSVGRLTQKSEITAMRACGLSIKQIYKPILLFSVILSGIMFLNGEFMVPYATQRGEEIFQFEIKQKHLTGSLDRSNFWYREGNSVINIGFYDTVERTINGVTILDFTPDFRLHRRIDAIKGTYFDSPYIKWNLDSVIESGGPSGEKFTINSFERTPFETQKTPRDLYDLQRESDTFSFIDLKNYINKLKSEGVPTRAYEVDLLSKLSFPLVCIIASLLAIPFSIKNSRQGSVTKNFIIGVSLGFAYYILHALSISFASAGFIPILLGVFAANVLMGSLGIYLLGGAERG
jgi:lipopolysaccharide export system permease protein